MSTVLTEWASALPTIYAWLLALAAAVVLVAKVFA